MQSNCLGFCCLRWQQILSWWVHYPDAISRVAIIWGNHQQSIILRGNSLSTNCPRANYLGDNYRGSNLLGGNYTWGNYPGQLTWGQFSGGEIVWGQLSCSHIKYLLTKIYQVNMGLYPPIISNIFSLNENSSYNLRSGVTVNRRNITNLVLKLL